MSALRHLQTTGYSSNRIDMVFIGDGYTASEIDSTYNAHIRSLLDYLFTNEALAEPFGRYRNFFNIHAIDVVSAQSGADDAAAGIYRDTALNARYSGRDLSVDPNLAAAAEDEALRFAGFSAEMSFAVVNDTKYGGSGRPYATYAGGNSESFEVALHEVAHSFAGLADEYNYGGAVAYAGDEPACANVTKDSAGAKWAEWIGYDQPGIGVIGAYEGGYYHQTGIYRPSLMSKMNVLGNPFDAVAREQFILKFYEFVDPLDGYTDAWGTKYNLTDFHVDVIDPAVIKVDWTLDGKTFTDSGETFRTLQDYYGFGTHIVKARAYDPTEWVRGDRSLLEQTVTWTVENDRLLTGGAADDTLNGNGKPNDIQGRGGNDKLFGLEGQDRIDGGAGKDRIFGGYDNDTLTGGAGADVFAFNTRLGTAATDRKVSFDTISDFNVKDDGIWLDNAVFKKLGKGTELKPGKLNKDFFTLGTKAQDKNDYLIYDKKTGVLSYDADGSGKGRAIEFALLKKGLALKYDDFFVI